MQSADKPHLCAVQLAQVEAVVVTAPGDDGKPVAFCRCASSARAVERRVTALFASVRVIAAPLWWLRCPRCMCVWLVRVIVLLRAALVDELHGGTCSPLFCVVRGCDH